MAHPLKLAILGSTGSIGQQTLDIVRSHPDSFQVLALAAGRNTALLEQQVAEFKPRIWWHETDSPGMSEGKPMPEVIATLPDADIVVMAMGGESGLLPTIAAARAGKRIALANKESLVAAGHIIMAEAKKSGAQILPVDSEHSAIWQCLAGEASKPQKIILTASGGPFRGYAPEAIANVSPEQALLHPSWKMGKKVTVDSATLMNKGLEIIEAHWLFALPIEFIEVVIHPQSIIHSMVEFADGSVKAQLGHPDMRLPIQFALSFPERMPNRLPRLDFASLKHLDFEEPDLMTFPCLGLAIEAGKQQGTYPAVLSAADETAVGLFLSGAVSFAQIPDLIRQTLDSHVPKSEPSLEEVLAATQWAREYVHSRKVRVLN